jgi:hypothetical protein
LFLDANISDTILSFIIRSVLFVILSQGAAVVLYYDRAVVMEGSRDRAVGTATGYGLND